MKRANLGDLGKVADIKSYAESLSLNPKGILRLVDDRNCGFIYAVIVKP